MVANIPRIAYMKTYVGKNSGSLRTSRNVCRKRNKFRRVRHILSFDLCE
jgi:hypothetical protein